MPSMPRCWIICSAHWPVCGPIRLALFRMYAVPRSMPEILRSAWMCGLASELARLALEVKRDLLEPLIEDPDQVAIPADPHLPAQVLRRHRVVRLGHLDVAVAMDRAAGLPRRRGTGPPATATTPNVPPPQSTSSPASAWCRGSGCRRSASPSPADDDSARPGCAKVLPFKALSWTYPTTRSTLPL